METNDKAAVRLALTAAVTPTSVTAADVPLATVDSIRAALQRPAAAPENPGEDWVHPLLGKVRIGPMASEGYSALQGVTIYLPTGERFSTIAQDDRKRKALYLEHGILAPKLPPDVVQSILNAPGAGPANEELIGAIRRWNPPINERIDELKTCYGANVMLLLAFRVLREAGMFPEFARLMAATEPLSDEDKARHLMLDTLLQFIPQFEALFDIEAAAKNMGIPITQAGALEAIEASKRLEDARAAQE